LSITMSCRARTRKRSPMTGTTTWAPTGEHVAHGATLTTGERGLQIRSANELLPDEVKRAEIVTVLWPCATTKES
jgi:hypothetical protein